jgi:hypothetical protein
MNYAEEWKNIIGPQLDNAFMEYESAIHRSLQVFRCWPDGSTDRTAFPIPRASSDEQKRWAKTAVLDEIVLPLQNSNPEETNIEFRFLWV